MNIPKTVHDKIIFWVKANILSNPENEYHMDIAGGQYCQGEAFLYIDGVDYYVLGKKSNGKASIQIKVLKTLKDLPAILPEEIPFDVYERLQKKTRPKKG